MRTKTVFLQKVDFRKNCTYPRQNVYESYAMAARSLFGDCSSVSAMELKDTQIWPALFAL